VPDRFDFAVSGDGVSTLGCGRKPFVATLAVIRMLCLITI